MEQAERPSIRWSTSARMCPAKSSGIAKFSTACYCPIDGIEAGTKDEPPPRTGSIWLYPVNGDFRCAAAGRRLDVRAEHEVALQGTISSEPARDGAPCDPGIDVRNRALDTGWLIRLAQPRRLRQRRKAHRPGCRLRSERAVVRNRCTAVGPYPTSSTPGGSTPTDCRRLATVSLKPNAAASHHAEAAASRWGL